MSHNVTIMEINLRKTKDSKDSPPFHQKLTSRDKQKTQQMHAIMAFAGFYLRVCRAYE